jgi:hypothetical protein
MTPWPPRASDPNQRSAIPSGLTFQTFALLHPTGWSWFGPAGQVQLLNRRPRDAGNDGRHQVVPRPAGVVA